MVIQCETQHANSTNTSLATLQAFVHNLKSKLIQSFKLRQKNKKNRKALKELSNLDDTILKDIGVTKDDITWATSQTNSKQASSEFENFLKNKKFSR